MNAFICIALYALLIQSSSVQGKEKVIKKRQIYREQVLPHAGGKIPDTAFQTDRLLLNRLQKEGFAIRDGVVLEQRNPQVHPYLNRASRPVYRVQETQDGRYTPIEGRYVYHIPPGIETTYLYPQIHNTPLRYPPPHPILPQIRPLLLPSPFATDNLKSLAVSNKNNKNTIYLVTIEPKSTFGTTTGSVNSFINFNNNLTPSFLQHDLLAPTIFSQFNNLFGGYTLRFTRNANTAKSTSSIIDSNLLSGSFRQGPNLSSSININSALASNQSPSPSVPMMPIMKGS